MNAITNLASSAFAWVLGCLHRNTSRAFTIKGETYVVCLDCGREFSYSLVEMRKVSAQ